VTASSSRRAGPVRTAAQPSAQQVGSADPAGKAAKSASGPDRDSSALAPAAEYDVLPNLLGFWIRRAQVKVLRSFARHLEDYALSPTEVAALILMGANEGLSQTALASALDADQSTMVNMLLSLERRKLISRIRLPEDRRYQVLSLTRDGEDAVQKIKSVLARHNRALQDHLSASERKALLALLRKFVGS
jgi:DNA-binding MarR family transcriptional regulator